MIPVAPKRLPAFFVYNDANCIWVARPDEAGGDSHEKSSNSLASIDWTTTLDEPSIRDNPFWKGASGLRLKPSFDDVLGVWENPADYCCGSADSKRLKESQVRMLLSDHQPLKILINSKLRGESRHFSQDHCDVSSEYTLPPLCANEVLKTLSRASKALLSARLHNDLHQLAWCCRKGDCEPCDRPILNTIPKS